MRKKVGLLVFDNKPYKEAHIVFSTRNLTQSFVKINKISSNVEAFKDNPTLKNNPTIRIPRYSNLEQPCLLSTHGMCRGRTTSQNKTLTLLPLTVCTKHGITSFLPLDYVQRMGEYTRMTYNYPIFKVVHRFDDCVLEFPIPPPIGSSEEQSSELDYSKNCYQCFTPLSHRTTTYMYRYGTRQEILYHKLCLPFSIYVWLARLVILSRIFCGVGIIYSAAMAAVLKLARRGIVTRSWWSLLRRSRLMPFISEMEKDAVFTILS